MDKKKAEKLRSRWFSNEAAEREKPHALAMEKATRNLSTRSRNVLMTVATTPEAFGEIFGNPAALRQNLLAIRNLGQRSVMELEAWWAGMDAGAQAALLGQEVTVDSAEAGKPVTAEEPVEEEGDEPAVRVAQRLALTRHTLSVRSQNVLRHYAPDSGALLQKLVLNPNMEQELYGVRNLGRRSVMEICEWVERAWKELPQSEAHSRPGSDLNDARWTRFSEAVVALVQDVLGRARFAAPPPEVSVVETPLTARNLDLKHLLDALIQAHTAKGNVSVSQDPYIMHIQGWLAEAPVPGLAPIRLKGLWMACMEALAPAGTHSAVSFHGGAQAAAKAVRDHVVWWRIAFQGASLVDIGRAFDVSRERARQLKHAFRQRVDPAREAEALLADLLIEETGQIWQRTGTTLTSLGPTDALLWKGLAVQQGAPHGAQIWGGTEVREPLLAELNAEIKRTGAVDEPVLMQRAGAFFEGWVAPRAVIAWVRADLDRGMRPGERLRMQIRTLLHDTGQALSLDDIQERLPEAPDSARLHSQVLRLSQSGQLVSIGKRGYYMRPIPGFEGTSFQYDDAARMYLAGLPHAYACVEEIMAYYIGITGLETSLHSFHSSLQMQADKPDSNLVTLPFYHIGLRNETADLQRREAGLNPQLVTANLNHYGGPIPEPGSPAAERLIERFAQKLGQDAEFVTMAITHRHWTRMRP